MSEGSGGTEGRLTGKTNTSRRWMEGIIRACYTRIRQNIDIKLSKTTQKGKRFQVIFL